MNRKLFGCVVAGALGAALVLSPSVLARGGGGGGGGGHGGGMGGGGGMHGGGMGGGGMHAMGGGMVGGHFGAMSAGPRFSGMGTHLGGQRFASGPFAAHAALAPHGAFGQRSHFAFRNGFHHRFDRRFHRFAFFGAPLYDYAYYDSCWRRVWTSYGLRVVNVCGGYY